MNTYIKAVLPNTLIPQLLDELEENGFEPMWTIADEAMCEIALPIVAKEFLTVRVLAFEVVSMPHVDWQTQWSTFSKGKEQDGIFEINFADFGLQREGSLLLKSGPGFGDLSHPTTCLVLEMMLEACEGKTCIDIGSGSGILTVAAAKFGAKRVIACDIDPDAVKHTEECIALNGLEGMATVCLPDQLHLDDSDYLILINMIEEEQRQALPEVGGKVISSGIISADKESYIAWMESRGFTLKETLEADGWSAFLFLFIHNMQGNNS